MKNKKDCSLVVQLLKCNQSLDRKFVSQKMDMVSKLRKILTSETHYIVSIKLKKIFQSSSKKTMSWYLYHRGPSPLDTDGIRNALP